MPPEIQPDPVHGKTDRFILVVENDFFQSDQLHCFVDLFPFRHGAAPAMKSPQRHQRFDCNVKGTIRKLIILSGAQQNFPEFVGTAERLLERGRIQTGKLTVLIVNVAHGLQPADFILGIIRRTVQHVAGVIIKIQARHGSHDGKTSRFPLHSAMLQKKKKSNCNQNDAHHQSKQDFSIFHFNGRNLPCYFSYARG